MTSAHIVASDYASGRLMGDNLLRAEKHLAHCDYCQAAVAAVLESRRKQQSEALTGDLLTFTGRLLTGSMKLLGPLLDKPAEPSPLEPEPALRSPAFEPLRVFLPRVKIGARGGRRFFSRFGIVILLTVLTLLLPRPDGLPAEGHRALALFAFTASILALEPVSLPIAALMVPLAQVALGVGTTPQAFETFSRPVVFLILASLFLAEGLRKHGLTRRVALQTMVLSGGKVSRLLLGMMLIAALFSMWVENTATAAVLIPVALTIASQVPDPKKAKGLLVLLVIGIAYSASLGGMGTIMGSGSNAVAAGFLQEIRPWSFVDWMVYGIPALILIFPVTWLLLVRMVKVDIDHLELESVRVQVNQLGPLDSQQRQLVLTMLVTILLWVGGSYIESALGLPSTLFSPAMVAVMAVAYLAIRNIITWEDVKGVSWGIFFTIGAGLSLGEALTRTGATDWMAGLITPLVTGLPLLASMLLLVYLSALLTNVMNNTTIAAVFVPILISLAQADPDFNAVQLVLPVALATTFGYSLPSASGRMALVAASGIVDRADMLRYGLAATMVSSFILGVLFYLLSILGLI